MIGNEEQIAAYVEALEVEKAGYEKRVETCKAVGDSAGVDRYKSRVKQVEAEIARVENGDSDVEMSLEEQISKANGSKLDEIAAELGYEFEDGVSKVADKKAALLEHLQA